MLNNVPAHCLICHFYKSHSNFFHAHGGFHELIDLNCHLLESFKSCLLIQTLIFVGTENFWKIIWQGPVNTPSIQRVLLLSPDEDIN